MSIEKELSMGCTPAECYVHKRTRKDFPLNCRNRGLLRMTPQLHRWARIVEFVYQGAIHKECPLLNRLLIVYLLCKNAYPTHTSLKCQVNNPRNPRNPYNPRFRQIE